MNFNFNLDDNVDDTFAYEEIDLIENGDREQIAADLNLLALSIRNRNNKWWTDIHTGEPLERNFGELIALMHSELSEALEADRKNLMDDKLPHRRGAEVELADAIIRILDACGGFGYDIGGALVEKLLFNAVRPDHQTENRLKDDGKKY